MLAKAMVRPKLGCNIRHTPLTLETQVIIEGSSHYMGS